MCSFKTLSQREAGVDVHGSFLLPLPRIMGPCAKTNRSTCSGRGGGAPGRAVRPTPPQFTRGKQPELEGGWLPEPEAARPLWY